MFTRHPAADHFRRARGARALARAASVLVATACSDGGSTEPRVEAEFGRYALVSVNGQSLPVTVNTAQGPVVVQSASLQLSAAASGNPTYSASVSSTRNNEQQVLLADAGTYARSGATLTFTSTANPGVAYVGSFSNAAVSISVPGAVVGAGGTLVLLFNRE